MYTKDEIDDLRFCVQLRIDDLGRRIVDETDVIDLDEAQQQKKRLEKLANKLIYTTP